MGKYFLGQELIRVTFPDGEWCDIKEELPQGDIDYILTQMASARAVGKEAQIELNLGKMALLERSVMAWSFAEDNKPVPVNRENISNLRERYRVKILEEIDRRDTANQEWTKKK